MQRKVIEEVHSQPAVGHTGVARTIRWLRKNFFWLHMLDSVRTYVRNCYECRRAKAPRDAYNGLLQPLPIPERPWRDLSMDFVVGLPESEGKNAILIVADRMTKMQHLIPCFTDGEGNLGSKLQHACY
jgi:hypothetical protein